MTAKPPFLNIVETAEYLGTSERFIRRLIAERRIGFVKLGRPIRIPMSAIEEFVAGWDRPASQPAGILMPPRRKFGDVRRLPSGKWQASYLAPDGERHTAEVTFPTEVDAERYLAMTARQIRSGEWTDLRQLGRRTLAGVL